MKINENGSIFLSEDPRSQRTENAAGKEEKKSGNVYAGDLNMIKYPIAQKREEAQKEAMRVVTDAYANDRKIDEDIQSRHEKICELEEQMKSAQNELNKIDEEKERLRESYNIDKDSQEYQDLKLLEKREEYKAGNNDIMFTEEEQERLAEIDEQGMTEYQARSLELDKSKPDYQEAIQEAKKEIIQENAIIRGINQERLKSHPMVDAVKQKDAIMKAANDEIKGMLIDEVKEHLDEKMEEEKEKAEEKAEEKEEKEELIEEIQERVEELERLMNPEKAEEEKRTSNEAPDIDSQTKNILEMDSIKNDVKKDVENIVDKMKLVVEDIKGIKVDELL